MKTQINLTIPLVWKEKLESIALEKSTPLRTFTYSDIIREGIQKQYELPGLCDQEIAKCKKSFKYFMETHVKINHPIRGLIPFELYPYQLRYIEHIENNRYSIGTKFRQGGFTTITVLYFFWKAAFGSEPTTFMVVQKTDREATATKEILDQVLENLSDEVKPYFVKNNTHQMIFDNGSKIFYYTPEACRGRALDWLFIDEASFIPQMEKYWKSLYPCLAMSKKGHCIILSTTNGVGNWFQEIYTDAEMGNNDFSLFRCRYTEHPQYKEEEWTINMKAQLGERGWQQEILQNFIPKETIKKFHFSINADTLTNEKVQVLKELFADDPEWTWKGKS